MGSCRKVEKGKAKYFIYSYSPLLKEGKYFFSGKIGQGNTPVMGALQQASLYDEKEAYAMQETLTEKTGRKYRFGLGKLNILRDEGKIVLVNIEGIEFISSLKDREMAG